MHTKRFPIPIISPDIPQISQKDNDIDLVIRHLVQNDKQGPISAFEVFRRAFQLHDKADEALVTACVQAVLICYNWLGSDSADIEITRNDVSHALGIAVTIDRKRFDP